MSVSTNNKSHRKLKITLIVIYAVILAAYSIFLFCSLFPNPYNADMNLFGKYVYVLQNNDAVVVSYDRTPEKGDAVVCVINGKKYEALVNDVSGSNNHTITLSANVDGNLQYFTSSSNNLGVITRTIPWLGAIYQFLHSVWGILCIIIVPCVAFLIYEICQLILSAKHKEKHYDELLEQEDFEKSLSLNLEDDDPAVSYSSAPLQLSRQSNTEPVTLYKEQSTRSNLSDSSDNPTSNTKSKFDTVYPSIDSDSNIAASFAESLDDLKYKMAFQDTHDMSNQINEVIQENNEQLDTLKKYGIATSNVENGVELNIDPSATSSLKLTLRNDGSLSVATDNYIANIDILID